MRVHGSVALVVLLTVWNDWFVDRNAPNCATGTGGAQDPFCTITRAIAAAANGDRIFIAPGTYPENLVLTKDLDLIGTAGRDVTVVDGSTAFRSTVEVAPARTGSVTGLTLTGGYGSSYVGGGLLLKNTTAGQPTSFTVAASTVTGNVAQQGGGIWVGQNCFVRVHGCEVSANTANDLDNASGAGVMNLGTLTMTNSTVVGNVGLSDYYDEGIAVATEGVCTLTNTLILDNDTPGFQLFGASAVAAFPGSQLTVTNCTIAFNGSDADQVGIDANASTVVENSILRGNSGQEITGGATVNFSCIDGGWAGAGTGNISVSPMLSGGNFTLDPASPCVDAGDPSARPTGVDLEGNPRVLDGRFDRILRVDMGYLEFANVHLKAEVLPTHELTLSTPRSTFGLSLLLIVGLRAGELPLAPWGPLLVDPGSLGLVLGIGSTPTRQTYAIAPSLFGTDVVLQLLAFGAPLGGGGRPGNFSNAVALTLE